MSDAKAFDRMATQTLERIEAAFDEIDPDLVEPITSAGVIQLDFQGRRRKWVVNSQRAAQQIWLAAEQRAWHFAQTEAGGWVAEKSGDELFETLTRLLKEHAGVEVEF